LLKYKYPLIDLAAWLRAATGSDFGLFSETCVGEGLGARAEEQIKKMLVFSSLVDLSK